jgi:hypothetical protein
MTVIRCQVTLKTTSNMPEDYISNTFYYRGPGELEGLKNIAGNKLTGFYQSLGGGYLSPLLSQFGHTIKFYDQEIAKPNPPFNVREFDFLAPLAGGSLPSEVAVVVSFSGGLISGVSPGSSRGRVYLGPISASNIQLNGMMPNQFCEDIAGFAAELANAGGAAEHCIWSDKLQQDFGITEYWVNNEYDTQRRRGRKATFRAIEAPVPAV